MIRRLEEKDASLMLEWMHDNMINCNFRYPFAEMTLEKATAFIRESFTEKNQHFAIVDENDEYLGTISLKNISQQDGNAEYAIVTRKKAQGTGVARQATKELIQYAFEQLKLHKLYLNVLEENVRARKFYGKCGFAQEGIIKDAVRIKNDYKNLVLYGMIAGYETHTQAETKAKNSSHHMSFEYVQNKLSDIEGWMDKVENEELIFEAQEKEYQEYDYDNYWSDEEEWEYYDHDKIGVRMETAMSFAQDCVNDRWYEQALVIFDKLLDIEVCVKSEWDDWSLGIEDIIEEKLAEIDLKKLALMTIYADYQVRKPRERAEDIYRYFSYACFRNISIKDMLCIGREELTGLEEFWESWISLLAGKKGDKEAELLIEAVMHVYGLEGLTNAAREYGEIHPSLYLKAIEEYDKIHGYEDILKLGAQAMKQLPLQLTIRGKIALQTAYAAECNGEEEAKYRYWYEAYRSESTEKNYLRLYSEKKCAEEYGMKTKADPCKRVASDAYMSETNQELRKNVIDNATWNCLLFFEGELDEVRSKCINPKNSLGWSGNFIRCGISLFFVYLYQGSKPTRAITEIASNLSQRFGFDKTDLFWAAWNNWKQYYPIEQFGTQKYLEWLECIVEKRTHAIVGGQHRRQYHESAMLIAALGDVCESLGKIGAKKMLMDKYQKCYPRHSAFKGELMVYK